MMNNASAENDERLVRSVCTELSIAFANAVDARDYDRVISLFTEDGVFERWDQTFAGRNDISAMLQKRPTDIQTRHICSNIEIFVESDHRATGLTYFTFYRGPENSPLTQPTIVGEYHDIYMLTDNKWRIAHRKVVVVFGQVG